MCFPKMQLPALFTGETEKNALKSLAESSATLSQNLEDLQRDINEGRITIADLTRAKSELSSTEASATAESLDNSFSVIESEFPEMPTLIYDGPFSEHIDTMEPLFLKGKADVTQEEALKIAASFTELSSDSFQFDGENAGKIPTYVFTAVVDGNEISVEVTRQGGLVFNLCSSRSVPSTDIRAEDAVTIARDFLAKQGMDSMKESYYTEEGNIITINFAYTQEGVVCYPDLVKVALALDDGEIVGYDANGLYHEPYRTHHSRRRSERGAGADIGGLRPHNSGLSAYHNSHQRQI